MSISVKSIRLTIGDDESSGFFIDLDDTQYRLDDFVLSQELLSHSILSFSMHKKPEEHINEALFSVCGQIIGKSVTLSLQTGNIESMSFAFGEDEAVALEFSGVIVSAAGQRTDTEYHVRVEARSWDSMLDDNPNCRSFENATLKEIVEEVVGSLDGKVEACVNPRFDEIIPYCVQYNETDYQFLQRLAQRYGEWLYNDGQRLVFGQLEKKSDVRLYYPSRDIPSYDFELRMNHVRFSHLASSYNSYDRECKEGHEEALREYNDLSERVFEASMDCYEVNTLQNLHSGGYADTDGKDTILNVSTKTQARGEKAGMLKSSGITYCSQLNIGSSLVIIDNYIVDNGMNTKSQVEQYELLVIGLTHFFSAEESYSNQFLAIPSSCDYPPYYKTDVYPSAPSCRAKVKDNEDPNNLGRVRVQFDWQAQLSDDMMTPWLRIAQPYAGGGKGFSFIPEIGEEVMVDFEGGNAERPYVKGTLYNGVDDPDRAWLPGDNQVKAIRTKNGHTIEIHDEGNDGYIRIYDNEKENYILTFSTDEKLIKLESTGNIELYARRNIIMKAGVDIQASAGHDIEMLADNDVMEAAGHDMSLEAANDQQRIADNDIREHAGNDRTTVIDKNDSLDVGENQFVKVGDSKDETIEHQLQVKAENIREEAEKDMLQYSENHNIKASDTATIGSGSKIDIKSGIVKIQ